MEEKYTFRVRLADEWKRGWFLFSRNKLTLVGLGIVILVLLLAIFAPVLTPYASHADVFVDYAAANQAPSFAHPCGTDPFGRDILTRILFSLRGALEMAFIVLAVSVPFGVMLGLIAGYMRGTVVDTVIMRITDIFLSVPPILLALAIAAVLEANLRNTMLAVTVMWWPWYCRVTYSMASSLRGENYVIAAELMGAGRAHILFREILPSCLSPVFTKMALDVGWVILIGATLSYVGLGAQGNTPALGQMLSDGVSYMPEYWWMTIYPSAAIAIIILGFNLFGDGLRDALSKGDMQK